MKSQDIIQDVEVMKSECKIQSTQHECDQVGSLIVGRFSYTATHYSHPQCRGAKKTQNNDSWTFRASLSLSGNIGPSPPRPQANFFMRHCSTLSVLGKRLFHGTVNIVSVWERAVLILLYSANPPFPKKGPIAMVAPIKVQFSWLALQGPVMTKALIFLPERVELELSSELGTT